MGIVGGKWQALPVNADEAAGETGEEDEEIDREDLPTVRPEVDPEELARKIESSHRKSTQPPEPTFETLRESCEVTLPAELVLASLEDGWEAGDAAAPSTRDASSGPATRADPEPPSVPSARGSSIQRRK